MQEWKSPDYQKFDWLNTLSCFQPSLIAGLEQGRQYAEKAFGRDLVDDSVSKIRCK